MISHLTLAQVVREGYYKESGSALGVEWYVKEVDEGVIVTFRGSNSPRDWLRNILAVPYCSERAGCGHFGFIRSAERALADGLARKLKKRYGLREPIYFAGHSKGVESAPFAEIAWTMGFNIVEWVGFGCPKMWTDGDLLPFPSTAYRIKSDIVPKVVPFMNDRAWRNVTFDSDYWFPSFKEHRISNYIERLEAL